MFEIVGMTLWKISHQSNIVPNEQGGLLAGGSFTPEHVHSVSAWKPLRGFLTCWFLDSTTLSRFDLPERESLPSLVQLGVITDVCAGLV